MLDISEKQKEPVLFEDRFLFCNLLALLEIEAEVLHSVVEGDTLYDFGQGLLVVRILTVLYPLSDQIAEDTTEVVVTSVGEEGAGVGQHTVEVSECGKVCHVDHLVDHALLVIVEPPCSTLGDSVLYRCLAEAAGDGIDRGVIARVQ